MRYLAIATDYDGTLALDGRVDDPTMAALTRARHSGRKLLLVTGRELDDLMRVFPQLDIFDRVVAENGALLYRPADRSMKVLSDPPPAPFVEALRARGVEPLSVGHVIVATWEPHETTVLDVIKELGLELSVVFNKGAVMVLPASVNKATGLAAALDELELSAHNTVGVGDAENDFAFLDRCERAVAVANALPSLKDRCDLVTAGDHGAGVAELVRALLADDLASVAPKRGRLRIPVGKSETAGDVTLEPYGERLLVAGPSESGKSVLVTGLLEQLAEREYQFCVIDPEGDYAALNQGVALGHQGDAPTIDEIMAVLEKSNANAVVNLLGLALEDRPAFFRTLLPQLQSLFERTGRPHWLVVDEAHHMLPQTGEGASAEHLRDFGAVVYATMHPDLLAKAVVGTVTAMFAVGREVPETIGAFARGRAAAPPPGLPDGLGKGEAVLWRPGDGDPTRLDYVQPTGERQRHRRKYAEGDLGDDESFYFRGPDGKLNLRAQNLVIFAQMAKGVDEETWLHHLRAGDYSDWFRRAIKDDELADEAAHVEREARDSAEDSRRRILEAIETRYTASA